MPRFTAKRHEQILTKMIAKVVTRSRLSDVSDTSTVKHVLSAAARSDDEQYYQMILLKQLFSLFDASGDDLDERAAEISPSVIYRNPATKSAGNLVFYRVGVTGTVVIPVGTRVKTAGGIVVVTTAAGSITAVSPAILPGAVVGQNSGLVPAVADRASADGNVVAGTLIKFDAKPPGVDGVTNPTKFSYGNNKETDDAFRNRIITFIQTLARSTVQAQEFAVLDITDPDTGAVIKFSKAVEDAINRGYTTLYIDDGTGSAQTTTPVTGENVTNGLTGPPPNSAVGGEEKLKLDEKPVKEGAAFVLTSSIRGVLVPEIDYYVNLASGQINFTPALVASEVITADYTHYTGLVRLAQKIIDGDPNDRANYPGIRAAGTLTWVRTPQVLIQNVDISTVLEPGHDGDEVRANVRTAIVEYINTLGISGDVVRNEIIRKAMAVSGVLDVNLFSPANNVVLLDNQLPRTTSGNVTVS